MITVTREYSWAMGHRLPNHAGLCRNPHGHNYRVEVTVRGPLVADPVASEDGMVIDFSNLDDLVKRTVVDPWDHAMMLRMDDPVLTALSGLNAGFKFVVVPWSPTAENIAAEMAFRLADVMAGRGLEVASVRVWETARSMAEWTR